MRSLPPGRPACVRAWPSGGCAGRMAYRRAESGRRGRIRGRCSDLTDQHSTTVAQPGPTHRALEGGTRCPRECLGKCRWRGGLSYGDGHGGPPPRLPEQQIELVLGPFPDGMRRIDDAWSATAAVCRTSAEGHERFAVALGPSGRGGTPKTHIGEVHSAQLAPLPSRLPNTPLIPWMSVRRPWFRRSTKPPACITSSANPRVESQWPRIFRTFEPGGLYS